MKQSQKYTRVNYSAEPRVYLGITSTRVTVNLRLVTPSRPPFPIPWWGLRGGKFLILITLDRWKRHFREKNYIEKVLKLLLKNVEERLFWRIFFDARTARTVSKYVWVRQ